MQAHVNTDVLHVNPFNESLATSYILSNSAVGHRQRINSRH